jgi:effector-binding domain-containing protein
MLLHDTEDGITEYYTHLRIHSVSYDKATERFYFVVSWKRFFFKKFIAVIAYEKVSDEIAMNIFEKKVRLTARVRFNKKTNKLENVYHKLFKTFLKRNYPEVKVLNKKSGVKI